MLSTFDNQRIVVWRMEKEKILVIRIFIFPNKMFYPLETILLLQSRLTHSHKMTPFDAPEKQAFENTVGKGEIARNEQFFLFPQCFLPVWITFCHFRQI